MDKDEEETCKFYVSPEQTECGKPAPYTVRTRITATDSATVFLCWEHKGKYDEQYARRRATKRAG
jgi:hypothetical protein